MPTAAYVRIDVFPSRVMVNTDAVYDKVRTIVTDDSVYVYQDSSTGPALAYEARMDDFAGSNSAGGWKITTDTGDLVQITPTSGCGCGSRLKGFNPFPGVQRLPR